MSYTKTDLAEHVLRKLRVIDAGEAQADISAELLSIVTDAYDAKWEEMSAHGNELTYWPRDTIPNPVLLILRDLIALEVMDHFGQPISAANRESEEAVILRRLRRHTQIKSSGNPAQAMYY